MSVKQPLFKHPDSITESVGYKKLLNDVLDDYAKDKDYQQGKSPFHDYKAKFDWVIKRAVTYAEKIGCAPDEVLDAFNKACGNQGFICPSCGGISTNPSYCDTHRLVKRGRKKIECDWSAGGLFGTMGKGAAVLLRNRMTIYHIFMPVAWANENQVTKEANDAAH